MAKDFVKEITARDDDFAKWYTDTVLKAKMADYSPVRGAMIILPYGYEIWENIKHSFDKMIKATGHEDMVMPMLIPESLLQKEQELINGFAPEVAWVTQGGTEQLQERLAVRPTSEVLFSDYYAKAVHSYRDLPLKYNQWVSVMRWEKTTRPFLRTSEFFWQEGHTVHATSEESHAETLQILDDYEKVVSDYLAIPVVKGQKTESEKFAGAKETFTLESMMADGRALQSATSHDFDDKFAKAFDIKYLDKNGEQQYGHQTSWGLSTRIIGGLIMVHGDDRGLKLPPKVAPTQVEIIPIAPNDEVLAKADEIQAALKAAGVRVDTDHSDKKPGWKFSEYEMRGVPVRLEIGPRDLANAEVVLARRDTGEKTNVAIADLATKVPALLDDIQNNLYQQAAEHLASHTYTATTFDEFKEKLGNHNGFVKAMWCGDEACEKAVKKETKAGSRCIPFEQEHLSDHCIYCGKPADKMVVWAQAY